MEVGGSKKIFVFTEKHIYDDITGLENGLKRFSKKFDVSWLYGSLGQPLAQLDLLILECLPGICIFCVSKVPTVPRSEVTMENRI